MFSSDTVQTSTRKDIIMDIRVKAALKLLKMLGIIAIVMFGINFVITYVPSHIVYYAIMAAFVSFILYMMYK